MCTDRIILYLSSVTHSPKLTILEVSQGAWHHQGAAKGLIPCIHHNRTHHRITMDLLCRTNIRLWDDHGLTMGLKMDLTWRSPWGSPSDRHGLTTGPPWAHHGPYRGPGDRRGPPWGRLVGVCGCGGGGGGGGGRGERKLGAADSPQRRRPAISPLTFIWGKGHFI